MENYKGWTLIHYLEDFQITEKSKELELKRIFLNNIDNNNHLVVGEIIDCLSSNHILDKSILDFLLKELSGKTHYTLKLSVFDFFLANERLLAPDDKERVILATKEVLKNRNFRITTNQALINLIYFCHDDKAFYLNRLLESLKITNDYRSHVRTYNSLMIFSFPDIITNKDLKEMTSITKEKKFGNSVDSILSEVMSSMY